LPYSRIKPQSGHIWAPTVPAGGNRFVNQWRLASGVVYSGGDIETPLMSI
jgi:hypothetical protein